MWPLLILVSAVGCGKVWADTMYNDDDILPAAPDNLQFAFITFRHGIRTHIFDILPKLDLEEFDRDYPEGRGALTAPGKRLMLHVGKSLRHRYKKHVPNYDERTIKVTATTSSRTTMSTLSLIAGMFPAPEPSVIEEIPGWQPIPVYQDSAFDKHNLFDETVEKTECPQYITVRDGYRKLEKAKEPWTRRWFYKNVNKRLLTYYNKMNMGAKVNLIKNLEDNFKIWDTYKMRRLNVLPNPRWVNSYLKSMERLAHLRMWNSVYSRTGMVEFYTGLLYNQLIKELEGADKDQVSMHLHGSHDITLCALFWTLSFQETYFAEVGDVLMLELYNDGSLQFFLYSPLADKQTERFKKISLKPLCKNEPCYLSDFKEVLKPFTLTEEKWKNKCTASMVTSQRKPPKTSISIRNILY